jgi:hypothetical protein
MALVCGGVLPVRPAANANRWALAYNLQSLQTKITDRTISLWKETTLMNIKSNFTFAKIRR